MSFHTSAAFSNIKMMPLSDYENTKKPEIDKNLKKKEKKNIIENFFGVCKTISKPHEKLKYCQNLYPIDIYKAQNCQV